MSIDGKEQINTQTGNVSAQYRYGNSELGWAHGYLLTPLKSIFSKIGPSTIFELGCGNGSVANWLHSLGYSVVGIDYSNSGIAEANKAFPDVRLEVGSAYDDLPAKYGKFSLVVSLEVIEHLYSPRIFVKNIYDLLEPGGYAVISTPFHGYWKNLALALAGKWDNHFTVLWDGGHIKFWSERTIGELLKEAGFVDIQYRRAGRIPVLAKSMIVVVRKPNQ